MIDVVDRMPQFVGLPQGADPRGALADTRVLLAGVGSVGARVALHCARARVGGLTLVDGKRFGPNFDTQAIRGTGDVGKLKASHVARWVRSICPQTTVRAFDTPLEAQPLSLLDGQDVVIASTDNLAAEVEIGRRCLALGVPLLYAAVHGPTLTAQVRTSANRGADGACPACAFSPAEWRQLDGQVRFSCEGGAGDDRARIDGLPTSSVSPLCALAASLAALELLRLTLRLGPGLQDRVLEFNAYTGTTTASVPARNPRCPVDHTHTVLERAGVARPLADCTLRDCAAAASVTDDEALAGTTFAVDGFVLATTVTCASCGGEQPLHRFVRRQARLRRRCRACGRRDLVPHPFHALERWPAHGPHVGRLLARPLGALGARPRGVVVRGPSRAVFVHHDPGNARSWP